AGCRQAARGRPPAPATPREVGCVHTACSLQQTSSRPAAATCQSAKQLNKLRVASSMACLRI
ncbi:hypothetical protein EE612_053015, partial [Oryza sativa]